MLSNLRESAIKIITEQLLKRKIYCKSEVRAEIAAINI